MRSVRLLIERYEVPHIIHFKKKDTQKYDLHTVVLLSAAVYVPLSAIALRAGVAEVPVPPCLAL